MYRNLKVFMTLQDLRESVLSFPKIFWLLTAAISHLGFTLFSYQTYIRGGNVRSQCASDYEPRARFCGGKVGGEEKKLGIKTGSWGGLNFADLKYTGERGGID